MEALLGTTFGLLGLVSVILELKDGKKFTGFAHLLLMLAVGMFIVPDLAIEDQPIIFILFAMLTANFLLSKTLPAFFMRPFIRLLFPAISVAVFFAFFSKAGVTYLGGEYSTVNKFIITAAIVAVLAYEFGQLLLTVFHRLFGGFGDSELIQPLMILFKGIWIFLAMFAASSYGVYLIGSIYLITSFFRKEDDKYLAVSIIAIASFNHLLAITDMSGGVSLLGGDVLAGVFFGAFGYYLIHLLIKAKERSVSAILIGYVVFLLLSVGLLFLGQQYAIMGGMDAYIGVAMGVVIVNSVIGTGYIGMSIISLLLAGASLLSGLLVNEEQEAFEANQITVAPTEGGNEKQSSGPKLLPLEELEGKYEVIPDSSRVSFVLGPNKETKGAFKKVYGTVEVKENVLETQFDITMKLKDFTTFNQFRDESLLSDEYFKPEKYPEMNYSGKSLNLLRDNVYEIEGEFTMLGVTKDLKVTVQRVEVEGKTILVGSGVIDRTEYGMTPSATEGNIVDFSYQVELK